MMMMMMMNRSTRTFNTARTDDEFSDTDSVDGNVAPEPEITFAPAANIGREPDSGAAELTRHYAEIFVAGVDDHQPVTSPTTWQQERDGDVSDVEELATTSAGISAPDAIQPVQAVAAVATGRDERIEIRRPTARELYHPSARRPASHW